MRSGSLGLARSWRMWIRKVPLAAGSGLGKHLGRRWRSADLYGTTTGVFVGISANDYHTLQLFWHHIDVHTNSGGTFGIAANRVSYMLDLRGPSVSVDTACSSALVAVSFGSSALVAVSFACQANLVRRV